MGSYVVTGRMNPSTSTLDGHSCVVTGGMHPETLMPGRYNYVVTSEMSPGTFVWCLALQGQCSDVSAWWQFSVLCLCGAWPHRVSVRTCRPGGSFLYCVWVVPGLTGSVLERVGLVAVYCTVSAWNLALQGQC